MAVFSPSTRLLAAVHVGSLSAVVRGTAQSPPPQQEASNIEHELCGTALDECRQILTETTDRGTEPYSVKVTKHAVDVDDGEGFESLTLVADSTCFTVGNDDSRLL